MENSTLPALTWSGATAVWHELPRSLAAGAATLLAAAPLAAALWSGAPRWVAAAAVLPLLLALTGVASFAAQISREDGPSPAALRRVDPVLALLLSVAGLALIAPWGVVPAAAVLIVGPYALAYGAVRGRRGPAALRGGVILAAYRPAWALTLTGLTIIATFAAAASAGVLALVAAPLLLTIACRQTTVLLSEIDARQSRPEPAAQTANVHQTANAYQAADTRRASMRAGAR
ncbi:hypothetical protein [Paractinoplanes toevensis]|uniref:Uncharacterized protein n=1 Tax=Paractinoplanes toevensis TaxID=571911 RepID=A0A919W0U9_9ACTN|nr:hypothetical protein [Actinoplanes toevensis]GIM89659.1 hypothetical protein Ato02nite_014520 [Actinoplanes toevensis]